MIWAATAMTFVATVVVFMTLAVALGRGPNPAVERLNRLWRPAPSQEDRFRKRQKERAQKVLRNIGNALPTSPKSLSRTQRMLVRAGYRQPQAAMVFRGARMLFFVLCLSVVYFAGLHTQNIFYVVFAAVLGFLAPDLWLSGRVRQRQHRIRLALPDALDLLVVCVEAGLGLDQSFARVSEELRIAHPDLSDELRLVNLEMRVGKSRTDAMRELAHRTGVDDIKTLVAMLIQTERFGTSISRSLRVHSDDLRTKRRQRAEELAAKTPVKMVPVLVFFIFPALFVVILGPAFINVVRQLLPMLNK